MKVCSKAAAVKTANNNSGASTMKAPSDASPPCAILGMRGATASTIMPQMRNAKMPTKNGGQPSVPTRPSDNGPTAKPPETIDE